MNYWDKARQVGGMRWVVLAAPAAAVAVIGGGSFLAFGTHTVSGVAVANRDQVVAVQGERAEALAKAQADALEAAMVEREGFVLQSMQGYFADPANDLSEVSVSGVLLTWVSGNTFEGMASMHVAGGAVHKVAVHVIDDGRSTSWSTDPGALLVLFR